MQRLKNYPEMKSISLTAALLFWIHTWHVSQAVNSLFQGKEFDDFNLTTVEIIEKYGYPVETHQTMTEDGYVLVLHRIPHGKTSKEPGYPILASQPLSFDSSIYVLNGERSPGFFLADHGYDVWLVNFRGTHYTRTHKYLSADDSKFWDFSMHEYGVYDLPALIDYICGYTKNKDLILLGYSMGATIYFITASEKPEYQEKIRGAVLLGPVAGLKHSNSHNRFTFIPTMNLITSLSKPHLLAGEFQDNAILQNIIKFACNSNLLKPACRLFMSGAYGVQVEEYDERIMVNVLSHISGASTKVLKHFAQLFLTDKFCQYDYGMAKNLIMYGSPVPPEYHLEQITTPLSLFAGLNDIYATPRNIFEALKGVQSVKSIYIIPEKTFTHIDFAVGKNVHEVLYPVMDMRIRDLIKNV